MTAWRARGAVAAEALILALAIGAPGCGGDEPRTGTADGGTPGGGAMPDAGEIVGSPDAGQPGMALGSFEMTYYWLAYEGDYSGPIAESLYDDQCQELAQVSGEFADSLRLEGAGKLLDNRVLNYEGACACPNSPCFFEVATSAPWGQGVDNIPLQPFRSIAVDTDHIAIGAGVYIEELDGLVMPGDADIGMFTHDGCVIADDIGGAIGGLHIDFFAGLRDHYLVLVSAIGSDTVTLRAGGERCPGR